MAGLGTVESIPEILGDLGIPAQEDARKERGLWLRQESPDSGLGLVFQGIESGIERVALTPSQAIYLGIAE